eukprot:scaffold155621_cov42-Prasinocladus_malaysianus.AAC.2
MKKLVSRYFLLIGHAQPLRDHPDGNPRPRVVPSDPMQLASPAALCLQRLPQHVLGHGVELIVVVDAKGRGQKLPEDP